MELEKVVYFKLSIEENDTVRFAKNILQLVNIKSTHGGINEIRTYHGTNDVTVTIFKDSGLDIDEFRRVAKANFDSVEESEVEVITITPSDFKLLHTLPFNEHDYYELNMDGLDIVVSPDLN